MTRRLASLALCLRDTAGIKDTSGYGTVTSHYGMHMVAWHIPLAISGQQADLPRSSLTFAPGSNRHTHCRSSRLV